ADAVRGRLVGGQLAGPAARPPPGAGLRLPVGAAVAVRADGVHLLLQRHVQGLRGGLAEGREPVPRLGRPGPDALLLRAAAGAFPPDAADVLDRAGLGAGLPRAGAAEVDADAGPSVRRGVPPGYLRDAGTGRLRPLHDRPVPAAATVGPLAQQART